MGFCSKGITPIVREWAPIVKKWAPVVKECTPVVKGCTPVDSRGRFPVIRPQHPIFPSRFRDIDFWLFFGTALLLDFDCFEIELIIASDFFKK